ncbi:PREDICTED: lactosylceramide 1,3-N-acetyl-beta-D-glucosaminyltransferase A-like [Poecilia mexicana]|uniref:lactosylceramide 1,3-N-acetyl-beta-D-glucosaminyltransferase A-like n=1 Tax=Poecilia mexicana TaxID=48701 RepID=UPI00072E47FF|nr:PREDICTED: lactosylceramide 1,3-N-acetyl-beta-D-glucosaminyltransferase A-like [Poecilia mexicana]
MLMNFRRIHKRQCVHLLITAMVLCVLTVCWEELDLHVVSHMRSYSYRYLINRYDFLNIISSSGSVVSRSVTYPCLINHPSKCRAENGKDWDDVLLLLFVKSSPENFKRRQAIRETWGNESFVWSELGVSVRLLFVMGVYSGVAQRFRLQQPGTKNLWVGHVHKGAPPVRWKGSKYFVPYDLYPWPSYPDYTAGAGYVVSGNVAVKIYHATLVLNSSLYIDDVFMGMCAKVMGVSPMQHVYFSGEGKAPYHPCIYDHMITSHGHSTDVRSLWRAAIDFPASNSSRGFLGNLYCTAIRVMLLCRPYYQNTYSCTAAFP